MQEDMYRAEEVIGRRLPRVNIDVGAFSRVREVMVQGSGEEEGQEPESEDAKG